jgi:hypothetical protein
VGQGYRAIEKDIRQALRDDESFMQEQKKKKTAGALRRVGWSRLEKVQKVKHLSYDW